MNPYNFSCFQYSSYHNNTVDLKCFQSQQQKPVWATIWSHIMSFSITWIVFVLAEISHIFLFLPHYHNNAVRSKMFFVSNWYDDIGLTWKSMHNSYSGSLYYSWKQCRRVPNLFLIYYQLISPAYILAHGMILKLNVANSNFVLTALTPFYQYNIFFRFHIQYSPYKFKTQIIYLYYEPPRFLGMLGFVTPWGGTHEWDLHKYGPHLLWSPLKFFLKNTTNIV